MNFNYYLRFRRMAEENYFKNDYVLKIARGQFKRRNSWTDFNIKSSMYAVGNGPWYGVIWVFINAVPLCSVYDW